MPICVECKRPFGWDDLTVTRSRDEWMSFFCSDRCKDNYVCPKLPTRVCAREGCSNRVPDGHRMLCLDCYHKGFNSQERIAWLDATDRIDWERREQASCASTTARPATH